MDGDDGLRRRRERSARGEGAFAGGDERRAARKGVEADNGADGSRKRGFGLRPAFARRLQPRENLAVPGRAGGAEGEAEALELVERGEGAVGSCSIDAKDGNLEINVT